MHNDGDIPLWNSFVDISFCIHEIEEILLCIFYIEKIDRNPQSLLPKTLHMLQDIFSAEFCNFTIFSRDIFEQIILLMFRYPS